jgi:predicted DNA-binding protein
MHSTQLVVRVPTDLAEAFARASRRHERTVSAGVRLAMRQHLEELEQREKVESMTDAERVTHRAYKDERAAGTLRVVTAPPMPEASGDPA